MRDVFYFDYSQKFLYFADVKRMCAIYIIMCIAVAGMSARTGERGKLSPLVHRAMMRYSTNSASAKGKSRCVPAVTAFVKTTDADGGQLLLDYGCTVLAHIGDIYIASIPADRLGGMVGCTSIQRIEAGPRRTVLLDTMSIIVNAEPVYSGENLPQAYTGEGVVVGLEDIGFDLTHPTFYDDAMTEYRIKRFWDFLSEDTVGSTMYVGAEYTSEDAILAYARSRDGSLETHGTHTLGIAAGSGCGYAYRGMAYDSDICLVSNAVTSDTIFISDDDLYKFTSATDALGFKYIFDYADETGKPCVISFSEGSHQGFDEEEELFYETLDNMVGAGRILVASAGNEGIYKTYFRKEQGTESCGTFIRSYVPYLYMKMQSEQTFDIRLTLYDGTSTQTVVINSDDILAADSADIEYALERDAVYADTVTFNGQTYCIEACGYTSVYDESKHAYELYVEGTENIGQSTPLSVEVMGIDADVEVYKSTGYFIENSYDTSLNAGEYTHSIYSPGCAPAVICVGATSYRTSYTNHNGVSINIDYGTGGEIAGYSSVGPSYSGLLKPDVVAPGTNILSSCSSYYIENTDNADYMNYVTEFFTHGGRTYGWSGNIGTSMSTPVVAGAIALWLQANPSLTPNDIRDVFSRTCTQYDAAMEYPNNSYGYGEIDVYAGLLDVLGLTAISDISVQQPQTAKMYINTEGDLEIIFAEVPARPFSVSVYTTAGVKVLYGDIQTSSSCKYTIDMSHLTAGVYAVQITGSDPGITGSSLVRKPL